jgi:hypothetical protein
MQTTTLPFRQIAGGNMRPISWQFRASFDKSIDPSVTFFTLDTSVLDGPDILSSLDADVVQEWDKYLYTDFSDRVISMEITQDQTEPFSIVQSMADVVLNNYDGYFTPNGGSPIDQYILPKRPMRLLMGFNGTNLPQFIGLTEKMPELDKTSRTVTFHLIDFLTFIFDRPVNDTAILEDVTTAEILDFLFQDVGLLPSQYALDETSFNRVKYFYVEKGERLGKIVGELMEAEQGRLFMDELGIIRFLSRQNYNSNPVWMFDESRIVDYQISQVDDIINFVRIESDILGRFNDVPLWSAAQPIYVPAGEQVSVWSSYPDPVIDVTTPVSSDVEIESSSFRATLESSGETDYSSVVLNSITNFSKSSLMVFENTGASNAYIVNLDLWGDAIRTEDTIIVEESDAISIENFDERRYELKTRYVQDNNSAISKAAILVDDYKDFGSILDVDVKGNPALQIGDVVTINSDTYNGDFIITKIVQIVSENKYSQRIRVKFKEPRMYFILSSDTEDRSLLDGTHVLMP